MQLVRTSPELKTRVQMLIQLPIVLVSTWYIYGLGRLKPHVKIVRAYRSESPLWGSKDFVGTWNWDSGLWPTSSVRWASHLLEAGPVSALPEHGAGLPGPALLCGDDGDQQHADSDPGEARGRRSAHLPGRLQAAHRAELQHWDQRWVIKTRSSTYYVYISNYN